MAINAGFFNSVNGDRKYNKDSFNTYFDGLVSDGVYEKYKGGLAVTAGTGMQVSVDTGKARVNSYFIENTASYAINLASAHTTLDRRSIIVLRIDMENREGIIAVVEGENSSTPVAPTLTRNSNIYEMQLAEIFIQAGTTTITANMITDTRGSSSLCGWATLTTGITYKGYIKQTEGTYTLPQEQTYIDIPDTVDYDKDAGDILLTFVNGLLKIKDVDYTIQQNEIEYNYMTVFTNKLPASSVVHFIAFKLAVSDTI